MHGELARTSVTLKLLHAEYVDRCELDKSVVIGYDHFCKRYRTFTVANNVTSHVGHKAGRIVEVDWSLSLLTDKLQSTCVHSPALHSMCIVASGFSSAHLRCRWQKAEYM